MFNARISNVKWNEAGAQWARERGKLQASGSDSHTWPDLGCCATESLWPGRGVNATDAAGGVDPTSPRMSSGLPLIETPGAARAAERG